MFTWILTAGVLACLGYYLVIVLYAGFSTSFAWIWLFMAAFLAAMMIGCRYYRECSDRGPLWLPVSLCTICATGILTFAVVAVLVFSGVASPDRPDLDYLIVLGARVREDRISNSLRYRLDKAIEYIEENPDTVLVLSGGQGPDEPMTEALAMEQYLLYNGVKKQQMILEEQSASTVENLAYSKVIIEKDMEKRRQLAAEERPLSVGVLTSNYHVFRAAKIAERRGWPHIHGIASKSDPVLFIHFFVRECAAILKDKLMGNM